MNTYPTHLAQEWTVTTDEHGSARPVARWVAA